MASHALFFLVVVVVNLEIASIRDRLTLQTYLPFFVLFILFQLYADSSSYFSISGIGSWLNALTDNIEAVVLTVCDQPFVSAQIINQLVEAYYYTGKPIIASEYSGTSGVPALFSHRFFLELTDLKETEGAKQIIKKYSHEVFSIPFPEGAIDIDTPNEYEKLKAKG